MEIGTFTLSAPDRTIAGDCYLPDGEGKFPAAILCHGFNGSAKDFTDIAIFLAKHGIAAYAFDFCKGSTRSRSSMDKNMTVRTEKEDLFAVRRFLSSQESVDENNIFAFGGSHGGLITALCAAEKPALFRGICLMFPALCVPDDWNARFPDGEEVPDTVDLWGYPLSGEYIRAVKKEKPFEVIGNYSRPVLIFHGDEDKIVPLSYSERANGIYPDSRLVLLSGEKHGFSEEGNRLVAEELTRFIQTHR